MGLFSKAQDMTISDLKAKIPQRITYVGLERGDLILALANTIAQAGLNVVILDDSRTHDIYYALKDEECDGITIRGNLTVVKNRMATNLEETDTDVVFEYNGLRRIAVEQTDYLILACSPNQQCIEAARAVIHAECDTRFIILRDPDTTYTVKDLCHDLKVKDSSIVNVIKRDVKELDNYNAFTRNHGRHLVQGFTTTMPCYQSVLKDILKMPDSQLQKLVAKGGLV